VGYRYLQIVIEQVTGQPLETVAQELLFEPLAMPSTSFVNRPDLTSRTANGHLHALVPALLWILFFSASLLVIGLAGLLIHRQWTGRWRPGRRLLLGVLVGALGVSLLLPFVLLGPTGLVEFAWQVAGVGLGLAALAVLAVWAGWVVIHRLLPRRPRTRLALTLAWSGLALAGLILAARRITNLPVPRWPAVEAEAAGSARSTAEDLALFMLELAEPQHLSDDLAAELRRPQVQLSDRLAWGLGPGLLSSEQGVALWQWGQHVDFQSIAIIYPDLGFGVVVCTNNDLLNPDVSLEIAHRALGGPVEPIRRAIHLEYNYREAD
jgi:CubicO group peptidase (beta-lactamase class C family)